MRSISLRFGAMVLAWLILTGLIFVHELAHWATALLLGWRAHRLEAGIGPVLLRLRLFRTRFVFRAAPLFGFVELEPPSSPSRWREATILLAGPIANFALALALGAAVWTGAWSINRALGEAFPDGNLYAGLFYALQRNGIAGAKQTIFLTASLSFVLGAINLLPLWPLDGGQAAALLLRRGRGEVPAWFAWTGLTSVAAIELVSLFFFFRRHLEGL